MTLASAINRLFIWSLGLLLCLQACAQAPKTEEMAKEYIIEQGVPAPLGSATVSAATVNTEMAVLLYFQEEKEFELSLGDEFEIQGKKYQLKSLHPDGENRKFPYLVLTEVD